MPSRSQARSRNERAGHDGEIHPRIVAQELDGAFGHQGRAWHRVDDRLGGVGGRRRRPASPRWPRRPRRKLRPTRRDGPAQRSPTGSRPPDGGPCAGTSVAAPAIDVAGFVGQVGGSGRPEPHHRDAGTAPSHRLGSLSAGRRAARGRCRRGVVGHRIQHVGHRRGGRREDLRLRRRPRPVARIDGRRSALRSAALIADPCLVRAGSSRRRPGPRTSPWRTTWASAR